MKNKVMLVLLLMFSVISYSQINNFRLQRISPVIDMGTMDVWPMVGPVDAYGSPRLQGRGLDMGAAEYYDPTVRVVIGNAGDDFKINRGNSVLLTASGGTSYLWNTGETTRTITVSPDITTDYTVTVTEWGDTSQDLITVTVIDGIQSIANVGDDFTICSSDSVTLTTTGSPSATYLWSTGETTQSITVTPIVSTVYMVTVTEPNSTDSDSVIVYVNNCSNN